MKLRALAPGDGQGSCVGRREKVLLGCVLLLALVLRLLYLEELRSDVLFEHPPLDEAEYVAEARSFARGLPRAPRPFWQPPGTALALSAVFRVAGDELYWPRLLQAVAGTLTCAFVWILARRLMGRRAALLAAAIVAVHGGLVFSGGELLPATYAGLLVVAAIGLLSAREITISRAAAAGFLLGVCALFTPTILVFAGVAGATLVRSRVCKHAAWMFAAAVLVPLVPIMVFNYFNGREFVLISTNGGLNFFIGNNDRYFETFAVRPGPRWLELTERPWREARISEPGASSSWFLRQGVEFWASHPLEALALYLRKLWLFFHGVEIVRDTDAYAVRADSAVLSALLGPRWSRWPDGVLVPLALLGLGISLIAPRKAERSAWLPAVMFLITQAAAYAFFFPAARYRAPCITAFSLFAALAIMTILRATRRRQAWLFAITGSVGILCVLPVFEARLHFPAERELYRGLAYRKLGDAARAEDHLRAATKADSGDPRGWMELANALAVAGRALEAAEAWERAAACDPWDLRPARLAAHRRALAGDRGSAIRVLQKSVARGARAASDYAPDHVQLVMLQLDHGDADGALASLRQAFNADPSYARSHAEDVGRTRRSRVDAQDFWSAYDGLMR